MSRDDYIWSDTGLDIRVIVLGLARMADAFGNSFLIVVLPLYVASGQVTGTRFGLSVELMAGLVLALFGLISAVSQPLAGRLSDRAGRRTLFVILGLWIFAGANVSFSFVESYVGVLGIRAVQGVAASLTITAGVALVNEISAFENRGGNMGVYNSLRLVGFGAGPLVAGGVMEGGPYPVPGLPGTSLTGFEATFYLAALAALLSAVLVQIFVEDPEETMPTRERLALRIRAVSPDRILDPIFALGIVTFVMSACIALLAPIEPSVNERLGQGPFLFAVEFSALVAALAVVQPLVGSASDRVGRHTFIVAGLIGLVPGTLLQGVVTAPWQMVGARLLQGVSAAAVFAPALALAGDLSREGQSGAQLSVLTMAFGLGISFGQISAGYLIRYGFVTPFAFGALLAAGTVFLVRSQVPEPSDGQTSREVRPSEVTPGASSTAR